MTVPGSKRAGELRKLPSLLVSGGCGNLQPFNVAITLRVMSGALLIPNLESKVVRTIQVQTTNNSVCHLPGT